MTPAKLALLEPGTEVSIRPKREGAPRVRAYVIDTTCHHRANYRRVYPSGKYPRSRPRNDVVKGGSNTKGEPYRVKLMVLLDVDAAGSEYWTPMAITGSLVQAVQGDATLYESEDHERSLRQASSRNATRRIKEAREMLAALIRVEPEDLRTNVARGVNPSASITLQLDQVEALIRALPRDLAASLMLETRRG